MPSCDWSIGTVDEWSQRIDVDIEQDEQVRLYLYWLYGALEICFLT